MSYHQELSAEELKRAMVKEIMDYHGNSSVSDTNTGEMKLEPGTADTGEGLYGAQWLCLL